MTPCSTGSNAISWDPIRRRRSARVAALGRVPDRHPLAPRIPHDRRGGRTPRAAGQPRAPESSGAGEEEEEVSLAGQARPCAAGVSFAAAGKDPAVDDVRVSFARYEPVETDPEGDGDGGTARHPRTGLAPPRLRPLRAREVPPVRFARDRRPRRVRRSVLAPGCTSGRPRPAGASSPRSLSSTPPTFRGTADAAPRKRPPCSRWTSRSGRPGRPNSSRVPRDVAVVDDDDRSSDLLYRNALEFATGHTCSARWETGDAAGTAATVATTWIPRTTVPSTNPDGHAVFDSPSRRPGPQAAVRRVARRRATQRPRHRARGTARRIWPVARRAGRRRRLPSRGAPAAGAQEHQGVRVRPRPHEQGRRGHRRRSRDGHRVRPREPGHGHPAFVGSRTSAAAGGSSGVPSSSVSSCSRRPRSPIADTPTATSWTCSGFRRAAARRRRTSP